GRAYRLLAEQLDDGRTSWSSDETSFYADLLRYLRCDELRPFDAKSLDDPPGFRRAHALLAVEELRVRRHRREGAPAGPERWLAEKRLDWTIDPAPADGHTIAWPAESERWSDETTEVAPPAVLCNAAPSLDVSVSDPPRDPLLDEAEAARALRLRLP